MWWPGWWDKRWASRNRSAGWARDTWAQTTLWGSHWGGRTPEEHVENQGISSEMSDKSLVTSDAECPKPSNNIQWKGFNEETDLTWPAKMVLEMATYFANWFSVRLISVYLAVCFSLDPCRRALALWPMNEFMFSELDSDSTAKFIPSSCDFTSWFDPS